MKSQIDRWGYPEYVINTGMKKVFFTVNFGRSSDKNEGVPFLLTYYELLKKINFISFALSQNIFIYFTWIFIYVIYFIVVYFIYFI